MPSNQTRTHAIRTIATEIALRVRKEMATLIPSVDSHTAMHSFFLIIPLNTASIFFAMDYKVHRTGFSDSALECIVPSNGSVWMHLEAWNRIVFMQIHTRMHLT